MVDSDLIPAEQESRLTIVRNDRGEVIRANAEQPLIDWLLEAWVIDDGMYHTAIEFWERQLRHEHQQAAKSMALSHGGGGEELENVYTAIVKRMRADDLALLATINGLIATKEAQHGSRVMREAIRDTLNRLAWHTEQAIDAFLACAQDKNVINR